ncbi:hypothetical protein GCM10028805_51980 [Spirosoma harenae]
MNELAHKDRKTLSWLTGVSFLMLLFIGSLLFSSCTSLYDRAKARYAKEDTDTTYSTVTATVPAETVTHVFRTDTTHYIERVKQGRATVTIVREPTNTTVIAECDSASVSQRIATQIKNQTWGVDPKYQRRYWIAIAVAAGLFLLFLFLIAGGFVAYKLSKSFSLVRKDNGPSPVNPG